MKSVLSVFIMGMVPLAELRAAIPLGAALGLGLPLVYLAAVAGNMIPIPLIILFVRGVFAWMRPKNPKFNAIVTRMEKKADSHKDVIEKYGYWGLMILTAIPLPGTGAWTASLVAALMEMEPKKSFLFIALGVLIAGLLVLLMTEGVIAIL